MKNKPLFRTWFIYFTLYNLVFLSLQFAYVFSKSGSFIHTIPLPTTVYIELTTTVLTHIGLYIGLSLLQTSILWGLLQYRLGLDALERWHIIIWSLSIAALITSNAYFFPLSVFSRLLFPTLPEAYLLWAMLFSITTLCLLLLNSLFFASIRYPIISGGAALLSISLYVNSIIHTHQTIVVDKKHSPVHIVLIGVDSLNPNIINNKNMPTIAHFLKNSVHFKETISPLAHTYPAWTSILTGLYPHHHHASYNLMPPDLVNSTRSIAWSLQHSGYHTLFATDDRRFNNLGKEFGFQTIIGPKIGVNDVLLGTFNDFPLSNLIVNLRISQWLFPYNYISRASHFSYYPETFDNALQRALAAGNPGSAPYFIAVHFTLPHWPYAWAKSSPALVKDEYNYEEREELYLAALKRADEQVHDLLHILQRYGYLSNSLIVLLSDHGEALYVPGSRHTLASYYQGGDNHVFADYLKRKTSTVLESSVGHGTDLLSPDQYHCLLAIKIFQHNQLISPAKVINTRVALLDITPTIDSFLNLTSQQSYDGISLLKSITSQHPTLPLRSFIMESGMLPNQFLTREKARLLGKKFFNIAPNSEQLVLRKNELRTIDAMKLYAVIEGPWVFALYPDDTGYIPIIQNLENGKWTDELNSHFARTSPALSMLERLNQFYNKKWNLAVVDF